MRIPPGNQEHGIALLNRIADEGILRFQVENVVLVDARRHDHQRPLGHGSSEGRVLDELHQLVFEDDSTGRHGEIAPDFERRLVSHRNPPLLEVGQQVLDALLDALALSIDSALDKFGVGGEEIRRRGSVDELARHEAHAIAGVFVVYRQRLDGLAEILGVDEIGLAQVIEDRTACPGWMLEAPVTGLGLGNWQRIRACSSLEHGLPQPRMAAAPFVLQRRKRLIVRLPSLGQRFQRC